MRTIWKFTLDVLDRQTIQLPAGAEILSVQMQEGFPKLWALVDTSAPLQAREVLLFGTGHDVGPVGRFIGTFQLAGGALVFHLFEAPGLSQ